MDLGIAGRNAIVCASSRGLGKACATSLARNGVNVTINGRDSVVLEKTAADIRAVAPDVEVTMVVGDVADRQCQAALLSATPEVDILVNNAAFARAEDRVPVVDMDDEIFKKVIDIKVIGGYLFAKAVAKILIAQDHGGQIINLSSTAGRQGSARTSAYNTANFALHGFTQALAHELAPNQITVNAVCPGPVTTARMDVLGDKGWEATLSRIPMGRAATDEDIAGVVLSLIHI